ncbi:MULTISPECIES: hypothetical protein [Chryseobacterium]|jgi:hypothetical protein|uniref:Uncharacterized protein n=1 Tax=Chryseobacterium lathyri TaxID=395933 RepID=A0A511Y9T4_9FLAO|nr:hypothetical protein [Chryseobacterium lathyri]GEN71954.1 hypothetical protein CLA01_20260 [Chryseobacterium lathyri]
MKKVFTPVINTSSFEELILKKQGNEGNSTLVISTIDEKIKNTDIYAGFINLCQEFNIEVQNFMQDDFCHVVISVNGTGSLSMMYEDPFTDISIDLASVLYRELSIQIKNRDFIQKIL